VSAPSTSALSIRNLKVGFEVFGGFVDVLHVGEITIRPGESYGLVGESGSGKSVLALAAMGLLRRPPAYVEADELVVDGVDVLGKSEKELRRIRGKRIAMIFQDPMSSLDPVFTIGDQLREVLRTRGAAKKQTGQEIADKGLELLRLVELPDPEVMQDKYPHQLSGGQRQRAIIAMALACEAPVLIADEPTRNLDVTVQASVLKTMHRLREELGTSVLFIANNLGLVSAMCDRVGILMHGRIVETGAVRDVIDDPLHPYTLDLLRAIPSKEEHLAEMESREGALSEQGGDRPTVGCPHYPRCRDRVDGCTTSAQPELIAVSGGSHAVACWRFAEDAAREEVKAVGAAEGSRKDVG